MRRIRVIVDRPYKDWKSGAFIFEHHKGTTKRSLQRLVRRYREKYPEAHSVTAVFIDDNNDEGSK
jgi:hypothetical protein